MLKVDSLRVCYGATVAVDGFDLSVERGEVVVLLGPSGCGKTTVLRAIAGLERPDAGRVLLSGSDMTTAAAHRRGFGLMFQDHALFPHRNVGGNVAFGLRMRGQRGEAVERRVAEVLELVGLDGYQHRAVHQLSGGEAQRVALARALAPAPSLLLLDEPLGSLDRALRDRLLAELRDLFSRLGVTAVCVTHDQTEAFTLADRLAVMRAGRVVQQGTPADVWRRPSDTFVAGLLGFTNLVAVEVRDGQAATPWGPVATPDTGDGTGTLVVRPEGLFVRPGGPVRGQVRRSAFQGDRARVTVTTDVGPLLEAFLPAAGSPSVGDRVELGIDPGAVTFLPGAG